MLRENFLPRAMRRLLVLAMFVIATFAHSSTALAACTTASPTNFFEKAYLNEYFFGTTTNYLEVFIPNNNVVSTADWSNWTVSVFTSAGSTSYPMSGAQNCTFGSKTYLTFNVAGGLPGTGGAVNVILYDGSGNEIDYLKMDNSFPIAVYSAPQCTYPVSHDIDLLVSNYGNKDAARFPDGKGDWSISSLTGANTTNTRCASNDASITKTVSASTIPIGTLASFTITLFNPSNQSLSNVSVVDLLPSGLIYDSYTSSVGTYTPGSGSWSIGTLAKNTGATLTINFHGDTVGAYTNTATLSYTGITYTAQDSAIANIVQTVSSFNAFESSTTAGAIAGPIYTKLAGTAFALDVAAIAAGAQSSGFSGNVKVDLLANTGTPGSGYGADNCPASNSIIQTIASAAIAGGRSTVNFSAVANAYRDVRVRISYPTTTPTVSSCSTDSFAIRPPAFTITSTDATNNAATGTPVIKAGANFNLTATALAGYNGTPLIDNAKVVGTSVAGALAGSFAAANSATGVASGNTFTYSEVGNFGLNADAVYDATFTSVDTASDCTADFSNTLAGGKYGCKTGSVAVAQTTGVSGFGRFIPDHFDTITSGGMPCPTGLTCPAQFNGFVYSGQAFTTQVIARNAIGAGATTQNYNTTSGYSRAVALSAWDALGGAAANPGGGTLSSIGVPAASFSLGVATTSLPVYTFPTTPIAPTDIYIRAVETTGGDGVTSLRGVASVEGGLKVVSGRYKISNAYGSELLPLPMTATVQFWNGAAWGTSTTDSVTSFNTKLSTAGGNLVPTIVTGPLAVGNISAVGAGTVTVAGGLKTFTLNKPLVTGSADISLNAPAYLLTGSNTAGVNPSQAGRATFGVYKGSNDYIYQRESY